MGREKEGVDGRKPPHLKDGGRLEKTAAQRPLHGERRVGLGRLPKGRPWRLAMGPIWFRFEPDLTRDGGSRSPKSYPLKGHFRSIDHSYIPSLINFARQLSLTYQIQFQ